VNTMNKPEQIPIGDRPASQLTIRQYAELCFASRGVKDWKAKANAIVDGWEGKTPEAEPEPEIAYYKGPSGSLWATRGQYKDQWQLIWGKWVKEPCLDSFSPEIYRKQGWVHIQNPHPTAEVPE